MTQKITTFVAFALLFSLLWVPAGFPQRPANLAQALQKLERNLENVRELAQSFDNRRALDLVNTAQKLFEEARALAETDHPAAAFAKISAANALLEQAVKITLDGPVRRLRSQLENLLQKSETDLSGNLNKEADRILQEARRNRDAAENALQAGQVRKAVEHYRMAITLVERAISIMKNPSTNALDAIQQDKKRYEALLEKAREQVERSDNPQARQIFEQALKLSFSAQKAFRQGDINLAKSLYNQSVLLLLRAMDIASGSAPAARNQAEIALAQLRDLLDRAHDEIVGAGRPRARILFERARRFAREADAAIADGHSYEARWKIELARNMIKRARHIVGRGDDRRFSSRLREEIEKTRNEISQVSGSLTADAPQDARTLLNMSRFALKRAEQAAGAGYQRLSLEAVLAAQRFLNSAETVLSTRTTDSVSRDAIQVRLNQLDSAIGDAESKLTGPQQEWNRQLLKSAKDIRNISVESYRKGNYQAANEGIQVAFDLVRKSLKNIPKN